MFTYQCRFDIVIRVFNLHNLNHYLKKPKQINEEGSNEGNLKKNYYSTDLQLLLIWNFRSLQWNQLWRFNVGNLLPQSCLHVCFCLFDLLLGLFASGLLLWNDGLLLQNVCQNFTTQRGRRINHGLKNFPKDYPSVQL